MKSEKIISGIKTAGVVLTATLTMNSCAPEQLSEKELQTVEHKTDSAVNVHREYKIAKNIVDLIQARANKYHNANKILLRKYAKNYIKSYVKDVTIARFMHAALDNEVLMFASNGDIESDDGFAENVDINTLSMMQRIRREQRWYNDLLLFLSDKYTEQQLLKSDFFKTINNKGLQKSFEYNTQQMEYVKSYMEFPLQREKTIRAELWNKYATEVKRQR